MNRAERCSNDNMINDSKEGTITLETKHTEESSPLPCNWGDPKFPHLDSQITVRKMSIFCKLWLCLRYCVENIFDPIHNSHRNLVMLPMRKDSETSHLAGTPWQVQQYLVSSSLDSVHDISIICYRVLGA